MMNMQNCAAHFPLHNKINTQQNNNGEKTAVKNASDHGNVDVTPYVVRSLSIMPPASHCSHGPQPRPACHLKYSKILLRLHSTPGVLDSPWRMARYSSAT